jgi:antitoxin YefM
MDKLNYSEIKEDLPAVMEKVCKDRTPVIITRENTPSVVLMSLADYQAYEETAYLLKSPKNAQRLLDSIAELESGGGVERELLE